MFSEPAGRAETAGQIASVVKIQANAKRMQVMVVDITPLADLSTYLFFTI